MRRALCCCLFAVLPALARNSDVKALAVFDVRMLTGLSSVSSPKGTPVRAVVTSPAMIGGKIRLPVGSTILGTVTRRVKVGIGLVRERAALDVRFNEFMAPGGELLPLTAIPVSVDNARERVTAKGEIRGILAADSLPNYLFGVWYRPTPELGPRAFMGLTGASGMTWSKIAPGPIGAAGIMGLRYAFVPWPNPEILLPAGSEMRLRLESIAGDAPSSIAPVSVKVDDQFADDLAARPFSLSKSAFGSPGDIINIAFVGSEDQIVDAFDAAEWRPADPLNRHSLGGAYHAFTHIEGYPTAPVSGLSYQGRPPEFVFQKSLNTIAKRHHVRLWNGGPAGRGEEVWLGAATHDIGVQLYRNKLSIVHKIDYRIDLERTKIINDLTFRGCLAKVGYVDRPSAVSEVKTSGDIQTDGRLAVLFLKNCAPGANDDDVDPSVKEPNLGFRLTQRTLLETRNYLLRRNLYYTGYQLLTRVIPSRKQARLNRQIGSLQANYPVAAANSWRLTELSAHFHTFEWPTGAIDDLEP